MNVAPSKKFMDLFKGNLKSVKVKAKFHKSVKSSKLAKSMKKEKD